MNRYFVIIILLTFGISACSVQKSDNSNPLVATNWVLDEVLYDPGDLSGTWEKADFEKSIIFFEDLIFTSVGSFCEPRRPDDLSRGTYSLIEKTIDPTSCEYQPSFNFEFTDTTLTVFFQCIELCFERYRRAD